MDSNPAPTLKEAFNAAVEANNIEALRFLFNLDNSLAPRGLDASITLAKSLALNRAVYDNDVESQKP